MRRPDPRPKALLENDWLWQIDYLIAEVGMPAPDGFETESCSLAECRAEVTELLAISPKE
jgi:hypothetical protein